MSVDPALVLCAAIAIALFVWLARMDDDDEG